MADTENFEDESFDLDELNESSSGNRFVFLHDGLFFDDSK